ncbi:MAG: hypothetical protein ACI959_001998, partial [Limisphaerales bacterium]
MDNMGDLDGIENIIVSMQKAGGIYFFYLNADDKTNYPEHFIYTV